MARQKGPVKIIGTLDDITFYKMGDSGYIARIKSSLDANRVKTDPNFELSRRASEEFGRASRGAKLLKLGLLWAGGHLSDTRIISRLTGKLRGIIQTDLTQMKGDRQLDNADLSGLVGFEWNKWQAFSTVCRVRPQFSIDAASGAMQVDMPQLEAGINLRPPDGATHFELIM